MSVTRELVRDSYSRQFSRFTRPQLAEISVYMNGLRAKARELGSAPKVRVNASVQALDDMIYSTPTVRMNFTKMIDQVPRYYAEESAPGEFIHGYYLQSIEDMLQQLDAIVSSPGPEYNETGLVGFPINTVLNWTMGVPAGATAFQMEIVNTHMKAILDEWYSKQLDTENSLTVFNKGINGWCSDPALERLFMDEFLVGDNLTDFRAGYSGDPSSFPYDSWGDFFIRKFHDIDDLRPVSPFPSVISSPCESHVYDIQQGVKLEDWFWVKGRPYSLNDMLLNDGTNVDDTTHKTNYVDVFDGGDVYQAFLAADKYHCWHSPVAGTVKRAYLIPGTYYAVAPTEGMDSSSPDLSQSFIAHTATRAVFFIESDNSDIGLVCFSGIGMAEVSTCAIDSKFSGIVEPAIGVPVAKGELIGWFQFGGSTSTLVFRPSVINQFSVNPGDDVFVRSNIASTE